MIEESGQADIARQVNGVEFEEARDGRLQARDWERQESSMAKLDVLHAGVTGTAR